MRVLIWFHRDLRTHDHAGLHWALTAGHEVIGLAFQPSPTSSRQKLQFWRECAEDLSKNFSAAGFPFHLLDGTPATDIPRLVAEYKVDKIITHRRMNNRDEREVEEVAHQTTADVMRVGDTTLFSSDRAGEVTLKLLKPFTRFKNHAMQWPVPEETPRSSVFPALNVAVDRAAETATVEWSAGGEAAGLARLHDYVWTTQAVLHYHETRNGMIERDDSSKFSRWLAWGALSPRRIYHQLTLLEREVGDSPGTAGLIYELVWRDYFKFLALISKEALFDERGLQASSLKFLKNDQQVAGWCNGHTGDDFVDANMRELLLTGWMSNRGRQNVASYFAKTANLNWTLGAKWFEDQLIDEDPESNWGNWQYLAGVGTDPRDRKFDTERQAANYDPERRYRNLWLKRVRSDS